MNHELYAVLALVAYNLLREWMFAKERRDLMDRLMAKSLGEFNYEARKKDVIAEAKTARSKTEHRRAMSDVELAEWEQKHASQLEDLNKDLEAKLAHLKQSFARPAAEPAPR